VAAADGSIHRSREPRPPALNTVALLKAAS
jgi:hypothetical protein